FPLPRHQGSHSRPIAPDHWYKATGKLHRNRRCPRSGGQKRPAMCRSLLCADRQPPARQAPCSAPGKLPETTVSTCKMCRGETEPDSPPSTCVCLRVDSAPPECGGGPMSRNLSSPSEHP